MNGVVDISLHKHFSLTELSKQAAISLKKKQKIKCLLSKMTPLEASVMSNESKVYKNVTDPC